MLQKVYYSDDSERVKTVLRQHHVPWKTSVYEGRNILLFFINERGRPPKGIPARFEGHLSTTPGEDGFMSAAEFHAAFPHTINPMITKTFFANLRSSQDVHNVRGEILLPTSVLAPYLQSHNEATARDFISRTAMWSLLHAFVLDSSSVEQPHGYLQHCASLPALTAEVFGAQF